MRDDLNSQLGAEDLNIWHYSSSNTLFEHAVLTRRLFTIDQTLLLQTACLTKLKHGVSKQRVWIICK